MAYGSVISLIAIFLWTSDYCSVLNFKFASIYFVAQMNYGSYFRGYLVEDVKI
jgi:hypothetical protein